ncbi:hypothetical protein [Brevundimonas sp.]|uniref:hypothetical protein n=1 Tax=Brevundimonas sp. TaxID=1871086 RepID=UPI002737ECEE|nr:hypothetical protein [Brevundimonas sp.]MDP3802164.1 hypothetical protein [Brevundimonas sp.]
MIARSLMIAAAVFSMACSSVDHSSNAQWLTGDFRAAPVERLHQQEAMDLLGDASLKPISVGRAQSLLEVDRLAEAEHHYLARARYVGTTNAGRGMPRGISWSVDVDSQRIAHVISFRLSREPDIVETVIVISSSLPLEGVVATAMSAE